MGINLEQPPLYELLKDPTRRDEGFRRLMAKYGDRLYWHMKEGVISNEP